MAKKTTEILARDVTIFFRLKFDPKSQENRNNDECFYCNKKKHYVKDCNKRKTEKKDINNQKVKQVH